MCLYKDYQRVLQETREITHSYFLNCANKPINFISSNKFSKNKIVQDYIFELKELLNAKNFGLSPEKINGFFQKMGEVHFYCLCLERKIILSRVTEKKSEKTPDFLFESDNTTFYFEVKTPSLVDGEIAIKNDMEHGFNLKHQLVNIKNDQFEILISEHNSYGKMLKIHGHIMGPIEALSEKITNNFKAGQFSKDNTFMVVNLSLIHNLITLPEELNPVYVNRNNPHNVRSGIFWMLAFRRIGMAIFGTPYESHGYKHGIDGYCEKNGILTEHKEIKGLLLITNPPKLKSEIWGLFRKETLNSEHDMEAIQKFTDFRFNDELNTRGMCNNEHNLDFLYNNKSDEKFNLDD